MIGPFRSTSPLSGGLLWKIPWRLSSTRKARHRERLKRVDNVVATLDSALAKLKPELAPAALENKKIVRQFREGVKEQQRQQQEAEAQARAEGEDGAVAEDAAVAARLVRQMGQTTKLIERWKKEMPTEAEMLPRDKYTIFDRKERKYRKGIHKLPKWTRVSQRLNPPGF
ncbi:hypothetical protein EV356DRAFT_470534 [Viridothelium virens]|uniref:54S ribosomal protein L31, mitochondrial n=1 Tax=Viridothelium virens TaxID=1048519 RepID=A0A6A6H2R8_VIRVR|nr:hypothetical protein EV356DRAFT_470534 [Viridothelium virens]